MTIDNKGLARIKFSEQLNIPNITNMNSSVLDVSIISQSSPKYLTFTWYVAKFDNYGFDIQLVFDHPLYVSCYGKKRFDKLQVISNLNEFFISKQTLTSIEPSHQIESEIPP